MEPKDIIHENYINYDEGWNHEHDSQYTTELFIAACCYYGARRSRVLNNDINFHPRDWPFDDFWWEPTPNNPVRELTKAGALFMTHNVLRGKPDICEWVMLCAKEIDIIIGF